MNFKLSKLVWSKLIMQKGIVILSFHFSILFLFICLGTDRKKTDGGTDCLCENFHFPIIATLCGKFIWRKFTHALFALRCFVFTKYITCTFIVS